MSSWIVDEVPRLYRVIRLKRLRETPGVEFDMIPGDQLPKIDAVDRVVHQQGAGSPGPVSSIQRPWYMHPCQDDNLLVLHGIRYVDIYTLAHGKVESFVVTPDYVLHNGVMVVDGPSILVWPNGVFHRIVSDENTGSISVNLATHHPGFDLRNNFDIYDLNPETGVYSLLREGHLDQFDGAF
jgi:hypothetical protein